MVTLAWNLERGIFSSGTFAQDLLLGILSLDLWFGSLGLGTLAWETGLGSFGLGTLAQGSQAWGIWGAIRPGEPGWEGRGNWAGHIGSTAL